MSPFLYAMLIIGGLYILMMVNLYYTHWDLLDTRKRLKGFEEAYDGMAAQAQSWETKCRDAWKRLTRPPTWMQPSGLELQVGEGNRVPLYKPFGVFTFIRSETLHEYSILKGNEIIETKPLEAPIPVTCGDSLYLYVEVQK